MATVLSTALVACGDSKDEPTPEPDGLRTVLVYQVANCDLGSNRYDSKDIAEMTAAALAGDVPDDCNMLVYNGGYKKDPVLLKITANGIDTLKTYTSTLYSVQSERMLEVLEDAQTLVDKTSEFGLILWGHGSGWLQDGISDPIDNIKPKSFGYESNGAQMNITTLANVLKQGPELCFLYFDCCYMTSVETLYELRDLSPFIVGSCIVLQVLGMPYHQNVKHFFAETPELTLAAQNTFNYYNNLEIDDDDYINSIGGLSESDRTCSMSVIDTSGLDELAATTAAIYEKANGTLPYDFTPQNFYNPYYSQWRYFDFEQYVCQALCLNADGSERFEGATMLLENYHNALSKCIVYSAASKRIWNQRDINYHCGLSTFILKDSSYSSDNNYNTMSWYSDVASKLLFE